MVDAGKLLGVDVMTGHWEFTLGAERVKEIVDRRFRGQDRLPRAEREDRRLRRSGVPAVRDPEVNGVPVAIIGQAFPYTPIANPRYFVPDWTFGIQDETLQKAVDEARAKGAQAVVLLSHNGMDVDLKLATARARHRRHPRRPHARRRAGADARENAGGRRWSPTPAATASFLAVLDLDVRSGKVADYRYKLLPVFSNLLPADRRWRR